jgi:hypothetical protein
LKKKNAFFTLESKPEQKRMEAAPAAVDLGPADLTELSRALQMIRDAQQTTGVMNGTEDEAVSMLQSFMVELAAQEKPDLFRPAGAETKEAKFDDHDILGWAASFFTWWRGIRKHDWIEAAPAPTSIPNQYRVAMFGDWGSGMYGAPEAAKTIQADGKYQMVLHLGDTYYSGTDSEIRERLLEDWPRLPGALNRTLNGNHEMYTGGHAYFKIALKDFGQPASYFALQNDHWVLADLDSAYADHDLRDPQTA